MLSTGAGGFTGRGTGIAIASSCISERKGAVVDIGKPQRIYTVEPVEDPVPRRQPEPRPEPTPVPRPQEKPEPVPTP
jgi:hypothetical protein